MTQRFQLPRLWQLLVNRSALETSFVRSTPGFAGFAPVHSNIYYGAHHMGAEERARALFASAFRERSA